MEFRVFSRRWGHDDVYDIQKTAKGWHVGHLAINGECDKKGLPFLMENLNHDSINFPESLGKYMEYLWEQATELDETDEWIQPKLTELAQWVSVVEKHSPMSEFFRVYK